MTIETDQGLWDFALRLYAVSGVSQACLTLQEDCGVDVPFALFAVWLDGRSVIVSPADVARIDGLVAPWRGDVVQPLRAVRRNLKDGPYAGFGAETERLRTAIKAAELSSERIEIDFLEREGLALPTAVRRGADPAPSNLLTVVRHFSGRDPEPQILVAIDTIDRAAAGL